jgi:hypothetical protein
MVESIATGLLDHYYYKVALHQSPWKTAWIENPAATLDTVLLWMEPLTGSYK